MRNDPTNRPTNAAAGKPLPVRVAGASQRPKAQIAPDCRHYRGDKPCVHNRLCLGCEHYEPYSQRICVIKIGALGDVIRTLCVLPYLRQRYPDAHITWVSKPNGCRMLSGHEMIDRLLPFDAITAMTLNQEAFDLVINLDKEPGPCAVAMSLKAKKKLGIGLSEHGTPVPLNQEAHAYFHLGLSDELKFHQNTKSYPQLIYEALGWPYEGQRYRLALEQSSRDRMRFHLAARGWRHNQPTLGINVGAGHVFANKMWAAPRTADLIVQLRAAMPAVQVVLLGGPDERPTINAINARLRMLDAQSCVIDSGTNHDEASFVAIVDACDAVFSGDTMAMHVAVALGKPAVVFFGPTCQQEIDLFGRGEKLVASVPCAPCYKRHCDQDNICVSHVDTRRAVEAIERAMRQADQSDTVGAAVSARMAG